MAITFIPEIWSALILSSLKNNHVYAQPGVVNRNYEGEIANQGDTVRVKTISRPSISSYSAHGTLTYEALTDAQRSLVIDQSKSFSFEVDDIEDVQSPTNDLAEALIEASYGLRDLADQLVAGLYTEAQAGNQLGTVAVTSAALAYTQLVNLKVKLDEANAPMENRYVVIPPWFHGLLLENDKFVRVDASGDSEGLRNGQVGRAVGFNVLVSNNVVNVTGDDHAVMAGVPGAISYADQINSVEPVRLIDSFGTGVRGLHLYGAKVMRPDAIATVVASIT